MKPEITRQGLLSIQVCVPHDWKDEQVTDFANQELPTSIKSRWSIRKAGHKLLQNDPERQPCNERSNFCHIMLDC